MKFWKTLMVASGLFAFVACDNSTNNVDANVHDDTDTVVVTTPKVDIDFNTRRDTFRIQRQRRIDSLNAEIKRMDAKTDKMSKEAKSDWQKTKADINRKIDEMQADINRTGEQAEDNWNEFETKVNREMDTLQNSWQEFKRKNNLDN